LAKIPYLLAKIPYLFKKNLKALWIDTAVNPAVFFSKDFTINNPAREAIDFLNGTISS
jgi:hypothetical protein